MHWMLSENQPQTGLYNVIQASTPLLGSEQYSLPSLFVDLFGPIAKLTTNAKRTNPRTIAVVISILWPIMV